MDCLCDDNRFDLIEKYKKELIDSTNIETSPDEMKVIDSVMFRLWQMGWLEKLESADVVQCVVRCKDCKHFQDFGGWGDCHCERWGNGWANYPPPTVRSDSFCAFGERRDDGEIH